MPQNSFLRSSITEIFCFVFQIMTAQAEKYDANIKQYKHQLEGLDEELDSMKKTYFTKKRESEKSRARLLKEVPTPDLTVQQASPVISLSKLDRNLKTENTARKHDEEKKKGEGEEKKEELEGKSGSRVENDTKHTDGETVKSGKSDDKETKDGKDDVNKKD